MRFFLPLLAAVSLSAEAPPQTQYQAFEQALASSRYNDAVKIIDALIPQRTPQDGKNRPDPVLNALFGQLYLTGHAVGAAGMYLDNAPLAALPPALQAPTALAHGRALELRGDRIAALNAYRSAASVASTDEERRRAVLGIARQLLPQDPAAARDEVADIAKGPPTPERWEARSLLAQAGSLLGDRQSAAIFADQAWADAPGAALGDLAALRVATLRAGLAAARHDLTAERAMLTAANGLTVSANPALSAQLPICGDAGVGPADYVIFGLVAGPYVIRQLFPIAASRPGVVATFHDAILPVVPVKNDKGTSAWGTVFTVSCRSVVAQNFMTRPAGDDPLQDWFVKQGIYPVSASNESEDEHMNAVANRIDSLAARFGKDSPLLIGPRWQIMTMLEARASEGDQVLPGQLTDLAAQVAAGMSHAGAPAWLTRSIQARSKFAAIAAAPIDDSQKLTAWMQEFRELLLQSPFHVARQTIIDMPGDPSPERSQTVEQLIVDVGAKLPSDLSGREREAWLLLLATAKGELGRDSERRSTLATTGLAPDLCVMADSEPKLLDQHFSYNDYPQDLIVGGQEGAVMFDFDLAVTGSVTRHRIVYSLPSGLFDEASAKGPATVRYASPSKHGKAAPCRGVFQPIVWRIEEERDFVLPTLAPQTSVPTT